MDNRIVIRGAGELGSAIGVVLFRVGFPILISELSQPLAIRRTVSFSDAMLTGCADVEGIQGQKIGSLSHISQIGKDKVPVIDDSMQESYRNQSDNLILIDARMLKNLIKQDKSFIFPTIGLGPGFSAGKNCKVAVETKRGHNLGRILYIGSTSNDKGKPGEISGVSHQRVI